MRQKAAGTRSGRNRVPRGMIEFRADANKRKEM